MDRTLNYCKKALDGISNHREVARMEFSRVCVFFLMILTSSCGTPGTVGKSHTVGTVGEPCREDGSCDSGLACVADRCAVANSCEGVTCSGHGTCNDENGPVCMCDEGFHADGLSCLEDDPCTGIDCSLHGTCDATSGLAKCNCDDGYHADGLSCVADDACAGIDCSLHGTCDATSGTAKCNCDDGYHALGLTCVQDVQDDRIDIGFTSSLNKVYFEEPTEFAGDMINQGSIELAKNEFEAIQLVLFPKADMDQVQVQVSDLVKQSNTATIGQEDIQINVIGYVNQLEPKVQGDRIGWIPDPLLPAQPLDLSDGMLQAYLITVHTHDDTEAGTYQGQIIISSQGQDIATAGLSVTVWNFTLPLVPKFKTANFAGWGSARSMWPGDSFTDEQKRSVMEALAELGFRNRLPPTIFFASGLSSWNWNGDGNTTYGYPTHDGTTFNAQRTDELIDFMLAHGANHFFLGITSDIYKIPSITDRRKAALVAYLQDYYDHLVSRDLVDMVYIYNVDEAWGAEAAQHARDTYTLIKTEVSPDLKVLQNSNENTSTMFDRFLGFFDAFDINLGFYYVNDSDTYRENHPDDFKDFWWNVNIWPDVHPNLFLEYPLFDARIIGPLSYRYNMQGFEYWQIISTSNRGNYHPVAPDEIRVNWDVAKQSLDGCLIYPSSDGRIFSSLRYESFRDGMEDLDYLYLLQDLDPGNALLGVPIISGLSDFSNDQDEVLDFRRQLAAAIEEAQ